MISSQECGDVRVAVLGSQCLNSGWPAHIAVGQPALGNDTITAVVVDPAQRAAVLGTPRSITLIAVAVDPSHNAAVLSDPLTIAVFPAPPPAWKG